MNKREADLVMTNCIPQKHKGVVSDALAVIFKDMTKNMEEKCEHLFDVYNRGEVACRVCKRRYRLGWVKDKQNEHKEKS